MNPWADAYLADMLDQSAHKWPDRVALVDGDFRMTYTELVSRRNALAGVLSERGIGQGTVIATYLGEGWQHVVLLYSLLYLGGRVVPLNLTWEARELEFALDHADVEHVVAATAYRGHPLWGKISGLPIGRAVSVSGLPQLRSVIGFDPDGLESGEYWLGTMLDQRAVCPPRGTLQAGYLMFTSGSTAFPKGALIRQDAALGTAHYVGQRLQLNENDRLLNVLPFYHCGGLITALLGCHSGARRSISSRA
jgi:fatty-acyl-CoA synthase